MSGQRRAVVWGSQCCVIMFIVYYDVLLLPLILIIFSKPPSAELCKHTHGCQLSLESNQTILGFPTTIPEMFPVGVARPGLDRRKQN